MSRLLDDKVVDIRKIREIAVVTLGRYRDGRFGLNRFFDSGLLSFR